MALANGLWHAPRIHGELQKLRIEVSERTVSRILRTVMRPPSQIWKTFLHNHIGEVVAVDFFTVPTIRLRVLFVFLVIEHQRRKILHFAITEHPTAEWAAQQVVEDFAECDAKPYMIRDARLDLWQRVSESNPIIRDKGSGDCTPESLAECIRGKADRLDSTGMPGPRRSPRSTAPSLSIKKLRRLLSPIPNALGSGQGRSPAARGDAPRGDQRASAGGRLALPL